jgi:hypothetical protein
MKPQLDSRNIMIGKVECISPEEWMHDPQTLGEIGWLLQRGKSVEEAIQECPQGPYLLSERGTSHDTSDQTTPSRCRCTSMRNWAYGGRSRPARSAWLVRQRCSGRKPIRELVGKANLLVPIRNGYYKTGEHGNRHLQSAGKFVECDIRSFGVQPLMRLTLRRGKSIKVLRPTPTHRWVTEDLAFLTTEELTQGTKLASCRRPRLTCSTKAVKPSPFGVVQGFVFGDGSRPDVRLSGPGSITLYGNKDFPLSDLKRSKNGKEVHISDLPRFWKDLPPVSESRSFLLGWLAGYFAADGHVTKNGLQATFYSSVRKNMEFVADACALLGIEASPVRERIRKGFGKKRRLHSVGILVSELPHSFWIQQHHLKRVLDRKGGLKKPYRNWVVEKVEMANEREEVFCATVPGVEMFTLVDSLLTGNCPFNRLTPIKIDRMRAFPEEVAKALRLEYMSMCFNPRGTLYAKGSLMNILRQAGASQVIEAHEKHLNDTEWALYRIRRVYTRKGKAEGACRGTTHGHRVRLCPPQGRGRLPGG